MFRRRCEFRFKNFTWMESGYPRNLCSMSIRRFALSLPRGKTACRTASIALPDTPSVGFGRVCGLLRPRAFAAACAASNEHEERALFLRKTVLIDSGNQESDRFSNESGAHSARPNETHCEDVDVYGNGDEGSDQGGMLNRLPGWRSRMPSRLMLNRFAEVLFRRRLGCQSKALGRQRLERSPHSRRQRCFRQRTSPRTFSVQFTASPTMIDICAPRKRNLRSAEGRKGVDGTLAPRGIGIALLAHGLVHDSTAAGSGRVCPLMQSSALIDRPARRK